MTPLLNQKNLIQFNTMETSFLIFKPTVFALTILIQCKLYKALTNLQINTKQFVLI